MTGDQSVRTHPAIALVASTGGLDTLTRVLTPLPCDIPASLSEPSPHGSY